MSNDNDRSLDGRIELNCFFQSASTQFTSYIRSYLGAELLLKLTRDNLRTTQAGVEPTSPQYRCIRILNTSLIWRFGAQQQGHKCHWMRWLVCWDTTHVLLHIDVLYVNIQPLHSLLVIAVRNTIYKTTLAVRRILVLLRQCYLLTLRINIPPKL